MITKNTVFVLGAGASADYGFPLGDKLRKDIYTNLIKISGEVAEMANALATSVDGIKEYGNAVLMFAQRLRNAEDYSIDAFLRRQKTYLQVGKMAIAQILARHENQDKFFENDSSWYRILVNKMKEKATINNFHQNNVSFITFNYDRSLEHYLYTVLCDWDEKASNSWAADVIKKISILHLYGKLDPLPWETLNVDDGRTYGRKYSANQFRRYSNMLSIVFEDINKEIESNFDKAFKLLEAAERIYILGFGFDLENTQRLQLNKLIDKKRIIFATSYRLEDQRKADIVDIFKNPIFFEPGEVDKKYTGSLGLYPMDAYEFINKVADLT